MKTNQQLKDSTMLALYALAAAAVLTVVYTLLGFIFLMINTYGNR